MAISHTQRTLHDSVILCWFKLIHNTSTFLMLHAVTRFAQFLAMC